MVYGQKDKINGLTLSPPLSDNWNQCFVMVRKETGNKRFCSKILEISDSCLSLFGYSLHELEDRFQRDYYKLVHPEDRKLLRSSVEEQVASSGYFHAKYRVITKDDRVIWLLEYGVAGEKNSLSCTVLDITEGVTQCHMWKSSRRRLDALMDVIAGGVSVVTFDKKKFVLQDASEGYYRLFGYTKEEYLQLPRSSMGICTVFVENHQKLFCKIKRWLSQGIQNAVTDEYKVRRKDGSVTWITANLSVTSQTDQEYEIQMVLTDSTVYRMIMHEVKEDQRDIVQESILEDLVFDYEISTDTLHLSDYYGSVAGQSFVITEYSQKAIIEKRVYEKDIPIFLHMIENLRNNMKIANTILRFLHDDGRYYWYHLIGAVITNNSGQTERVVGKAVNMNRQKQEMLELVDRAQRDPFTKLYNKTMTEMLVRQYLSYETEWNHALLVIDVDNFKEINDTFGHLCGDAVLIEISRILMEKFSNAGVVGRIGGDEFLVFLRGERDRKAIRKKAQEVCRVFRQAEILSNVGHLLSASVGVAVAPEDGSTYEELFHKADRALYVSKRQGKNSVVFHSETIEFGVEEDKEQISAIHQDMSQNFRVDSQLVFQATEELLRAGRKSSHMESLLQLIGRILRVSRVYLAESSPDRGKCTITCEWCTNHVERISDRVQSVPYEQIGFHNQRFDECGLFCCCDTQELGEDESFRLRNPTALSTLHSALYDQQGFRGFIGCDDVLVNRVWSQTEMATLSMLAGLISRFLYYQNH